MSTDLIWILGSSQEKLEQPVKSNSVGPGNMSHCRTSPFDNPLYYSLVVLKDVQRGSLMRSEETKSTFDNSWFSLEAGVLVWELLRISDVLLCNGFPVPVDFCVSDSILNVTHQ